MANEADALTSIQTLLSANWTPDGTDSITPIFLVTSEQAPRMGHNINQTTILIYLASHTTEPNGLGASHKERTVDRVSIDIRTKVSRSHLLNCYNECRRIFSTRINFPDASFAQLIPIGFQDFTTIGFYRYVYDIYLRNWTVTR